MELDLIFNLINLLDFALKFSVYGYLLGAGCLCSYSEFMCWSSPPQITNENGIFLGA